MGSSGESCPTSFWRGTRAECANPKALRSVFTFERGTAPNMPLLADMPHAEGMTDVRVRQPLTRADFDRCRWEEVIAGIEEKNCQNTTPPPSSNGRTPPATSGDSVAQALFTVLFVVVEVDLRPHDINQPFGPRFASHAARGVASEDLNDQHWDILAGWPQRSPTPKCGPGSATWSGW